MGNILDAVVHTADIQDRDGACGLVEFAKDKVPTASRSLRKRR